MTEKNIADATKKAGKPELKETLSMMKDQLKRYRYYKPFSFLNDQERTTDDLMKSVTAAGLLQDMATLTADLNDEQKKRKEESEKKKGKQKKGTWFSKAYFNYITNKMPNHF